MKDNTVKNKHPENIEQDESSCIGKTASENIITPVRAMSSDTEDDRQEISRFSFRASSIYPADELAEFDKLCPGFSKEYLTSHNRILNEEVTHRREVDREHINLHKESLKLESKNLDIQREVAMSNSQRSKVGLYSAFFLLLISLGLGGYAIHKGYKGVAITIFGGTIGTLALNYAGQIFSSKQLKQVEDDKNSQKQIESSKDVFSEEE